MTDDARFLDLTGVSKSFGSTQVLQPTDLSIEQGEFFTLLGPSGCGKTTLLRIISGFEKASEGRVELRGERLDRVAPERRPFNMVFQSYALFPHMTVSENVAYGPRIAGRPREEIDARVDATLALVHLAEAAERKVTELSGGQQQRVALARALINEPEALLLDEPLGALDLKLRKHLQSELLGIQRRLGTTFVYVTHDQEEALTLSHRVALINAGRVVQVGTPREVYEKPVSAFAADFIGETNLIECEVVEARSGSALVRFRHCGRGQVVELDFFGEGRLSAGESALAALRPEHLEFCAPESADFVGEVQTTTFLGTHCRHDVDLPGQQTLRISGPAQEAANASGAVGIAVRKGQGTVVRADMTTAEIPTEAADPELNTAEQSVAIGKGV
jgi:spermidine/putrescine transport system ATP-binding protein